MPLTETQQQIVDRLQAIKSRYGMDTYRDAAKDVAQMFVSQGGDLAQEAKVIFADILEKEEPKPQAKLEESLDPYIMANMPGLKTQGQLQAFKLASEVFSKLVSAILCNQPEQVAEYKTALERSYQALEFATEITRKAEHIPEDQRSEALQNMCEKAFSEDALVTELLGELSEIKSLKQLNSWYGESQKRFKKVVAVHLRDKLFDSIRSKRREVKESGL